MNVEPKLVEIEYDQSKVIDWLFKVKHMTEAEEFYKNQGWLCNYCEYSGYCQKGEDYMLLPKNERNIEKVEKGLFGLWVTIFRKDYIWKTNS